MWDQSRHHLYPTDTRPDTSHIYHIRCTLVCTNVHVLQQWARLLHVVDLSICWDWCALQSSTVAPNCWFTHKGRSALCLCAGSVADGTVLVGVHHWCQSWESQLVSECSSTQFEMWPCHQLQSELICSNQGPEGICSSCDGLVGSEKNAFGIMCHRSTARGDGGLVAGHDSVNEFGSLLSLPCPTGNVCASSIQLSNS